MIQHAIAEVARIQRLWPDQWWGGTDAEKVRDDWAESLTPLREDMLTAAITDLSKVLATITLAAIHAHVRGALIAERDRQARGGRAESSTCRGGCDHGWHWLEDSVKPCHVCMPELYERWADGEFDRPADRARRYGSVAMPSELKELRTMLDRNAQAAR